MTMNHLEEIAALIPHRPPFLWVDRIVSCSADTIVTEKLIPVDLDIFDGHYPERPMMPGVLLCEAIFQTGALLMAKTVQTKKNIARALPVLTRISGAKFKKTIRPGDIVQIHVRLTESLASVSFFKGSLKLDGKTAVQVGFSCTTTIRGS